MTAIERARNWARTITRVAHHESDAPEVNLAAQFLAMEDDLASIQKIHEAEQRVIAAVRLYRLGQHTPLIVEEALAALDALLAAGDVGNPG